MKLLGIAGLAILLFAGCSRNEPGTMGGGKVPPTVATGAPAHAATNSVVSEPEHSAIESEHAASTFDKSARRRDLGPPDASTQPPQVEKK